MRRKEQKVNIGKKSLRLASVFITMLLILSLFPFSSLAYTEPTPPEIEGVTAYCLYNKTYGNLVASSNADAKLNTSTSAKVITGLIACEILDERLNEEITVTEQMLAGVSGYSMKLSVGERIKISELLYGAICGSYNDAAYVLAHVCAGGIEDFVELMNAKASEVGATATNYTNPIGYPDHAAMVTTASDTLKIALAASNNELYMSICSAVKHEAPATNKSGSRLFYNRNALISSGAGTATNYFNYNCYGMNAGYSGEAGGWSVITTVKDNGAEYICIALGGKESADGSRIYAYEAVSALADWACRTFNLHHVFDEGKELGTVNIRLAGMDGKNAPYVTSSTIDVYIPTDESYGTELYYKVLLDPDLPSAPVTAGTRVGEVRVFCNGESIASCDLILKEDYEANEIMVAINAIGKYTQSRAFIASISFFVVSFVVTLLIFKFGNMNRIGRRTYVRK